MQGISASIRQREVAMPLVWLLTGFLFLLVCAAFNTSSANAQYYRLPGFSGPSAAQQAAIRRRNAYRRRQAYRKRSRAPKVKPAWYPGASEKDPTQIIVSLTEQKVRVYRGEKLLVTSRVSSGKPGHATPTGAFSILGKSRWHRSNIYSGAPMPYMQRLTWSGIALHASNSVPNRPASHGCVRLPNSFAPQLFYFTSTGNHVIITKHTDLKPKPIAHDKLFRPSYPAPKDFDVLETERVLAASGVKLAAEKKRSTDPVRILVTRRTGRERLMDVQRMLNELQFNAGDVDGWMGPDTAKAIRRFQATYADAYGIAKDGLVSDELIMALYKAAGRRAPRNGHIYVRQNFKQLFDAPATILDPEVPLGSHLITAQHFEPGERDVRWLYVTLGKKAKASQEIAAAEKKTATDGPSIESGIALPPSSVSEALARIEIDDDVRERIGEILTPGSSLAISDDGLSKETHPKGTDFVLLTDY